MKRHQSFKVVRRFAIRLLAGVLVSVFVAVVLVSCAVRPPAVGSIDGFERLDAIDRNWTGLQDPVSISWDTHLIPSIEAQNDSDAAFAVGLVHAHLRLSQMEFFRRVSQGRLSEMGGPFLVDLDHAIRAIDLGRAVGDIEATLPDETRAWIVRYVEGVNAYRVSVQKGPADARTLGIGYSEPWTVRDVLVLGRLLSVDVNWGRWLSLQGLAGEDGYDDFVARLWAFGDGGIPSFGGESPHDLSVLTDIGRSGSNAFVVSGHRSVSGGALVASDPHLGLPQPNIWCVVGYRTPRRQAVGLTIPGLPFVLVGRSDTVAWTGTNMQSSSTTLYRLPDDWDPVSTRSEQIAVRLWWDCEREVRESPWGPVLTDAKLLGRLGEGDIAMRWRGHDASDEASAFFGASEAKDWREFRDAFSSYAVGGQNILYGDSSGNIGQIMAIEAMPSAMASSRIGVVPADDDAFAWVEGVPSDRLPAVYNPDEGFLVSANNVPIRTDPVLVPQGNANDRVTRMSDRLAGESELTLDDLALIQRDVYSKVSHEAAIEIVSLLDDQGTDTGSDWLLAELRGWDGNYDAESSGALAYQIVLSELLDVLYRGRYSDKIVATIRRAPYVHRFVLDDLRSDVEGSDVDSSVLAGAVRLAEKRSKPGQVWGDIHRLRLAHPIGAIPIIGSSYVFDNQPIAGSTTTIYKSAHGVQAKKHATTFGACARLLCDMGTLDNNRVVLLGGQDGWMGSDRLLDQAAVWQAQADILLPLSKEGQAAGSVRVTKLAP